MKHYVETGKQLAWWQVKEDSEKHVPQKRVHFKKFIRGDFSKKSLGWTSFFAFKC